MRVFVRAHLGMRVLCFRTCMLVFFVCGRVCAQKPVKWQTLAFEDRALSLINAGWVEAVAAFCRRSEDAGTGRDGTNAKHFVLAHVQKSQKLV